MSQQMNYDETRGERQSPSLQGYEAGYHDPYIASTGQKLSMRDFGRGASSGQRLALAIVSIVMLVIITGILFSPPNAFNPFFLVVVGMVCVAILGINIVLNNSR